MRYFVIRASEDGDVRVSCFTKAELEAKLAENYWGEDPRFLTENDNLEYCSGILIIRGERVDPKPVETVKSWSLE